MRRDLWELALRLRNKRERLNGRLGGHPNMVSSPVRVPEAVISDWIIRKYEEDNLES